MSQTHSKEEKPRMPRFRRLDNRHISAIESLYKQYPFLKDRMEIHMPFHRAKPTFSSGTVWVWPKFDRRPVGYVIFMEDFPPCIWYPERQEGMTFRFLLPPSFCRHGPTIFLANILAGESTLQIEDLVVYKGTDLWSTVPFSERWEDLTACWHSLPADQPLLAFEVRVVRPISLADWEQHYDPNLYWIIQPDHSHQPRWFWKDTVTANPHARKEYVAPQLKRAADLPIQLCATCTPYTKLALPDTYSLLAQDGETIGIASIGNLDLSKTLREHFHAHPEQDLAVEVRWKEDFKKYQIVRILPKETMISTLSFFYHS